MYWLTPSTQVPPFWQGLLAHSLISVGLGENDTCSQLVEKLQQSPGTFNLNPMFPFFPIHIQITAAILSSHPYMSKQLTVLLSTLTKKNHVLDAGLRIKYIEQLNTDS